MDPTDPNYRWCLGQLQYRLAPFIRTEAQLFEALVGLLGVGHEVVRASEATLWLMELEREHVVLRCGDTITVSPEGLRRYLLHRGQAVSLWLEEEDTP